MLLYHGTSSKKASNIKEQGFFPNSYFTTSLEDASYYAAIGGEWDLEKREKEWQKIYSKNPRKHFYPDLWDMYQVLYPKEEHPVVLVCEIPENYSFKKDSGGENAIVFELSLPRDVIIKEILVEW